VRRLICLLGLTLAVGLLVFASPLASADPVCQVENPETGECEVWVDTEPEASVPSNPGTPPVGDSGDSGPACVYGGKPIDCKGPYGQWSDGEQCYVEPMEPQPPATDPSWGPYVGDTNAPGAIYWCHMPGSGAAIPLWLENPPSGPGGPSPYEIALSAVARLRLKAINIGVVPEPGPDSMGLVGMPTWMWVDKPTATTFGPTGVSASAGGITVSLDATVERIEWDMGDGSEPVVCTGSGTPYADHYGKDDSPTCGHRYEKTSWSEPGHAFTVTARSYWRIDWAGAGQSGTIRLDPLQESVDLRVGEAQVLTQ
jgi:hypothetical protein